jgi:hypothetical protein
MCYYNKIFGHSSSQKVLRTNKIRSRNWKKNSHTFWARNSRNLVLWPYSCEVSGPPRRQLRLYWWGISWNLKQITRSFPKISYKQICIDNDPPPRDISPVRLDMYYNTVCSENVYPYKVQPIGKRALILLKKIRRPNSTGMLTGIAAINTGKCIDR